MKGKLIIEYDDVSKNHLIDVAEVFCYRKIENGIYKK